jgi:hypothetical protein
VSKDSTGIYELINTVKHYPKYAKYSVFPTKPTINGGAEIMVRKATLMYRPKAMAGTPNFKHISSVRFGGGMMV